MRLYIKLAAFVCAFAAIQCALVSEQGGQAMFYVRAYIAVVRGETATDEVTTEDFYNRHCFGQSTAEIDQNVTTAIRRMRADCADYGYAGGAEPVAREQLAAGR